MRMRSSTVKTTFCFIIFLIFANCHDVYALSLMEAYQAALANDSIYQSAINENEAGKQYQEIGRANLLPNISASYSYNRNNSDISFSGSRAIRNETRNYNSENGVIQLRQPIINYEGMARYREGNLQTALSEQQFEDKKQELIKRFFGLYAQANYALDVLALAQAERDAYKNQEEANKLMAVRGEGTKTALIESQAKLSLSEAQLIESQEGVTDAKAALSQMLGQEINVLDTLSDDFKIEPLALKDFESLKTLALEHNPVIEAQRKSVDLAYQEIMRNRAGHMPKLDALANISNSKSDSVSTFNQEIDNTSLGLQLNIPIYSGGAVAASTAQAEANYNKAKNDLQTKINEVLLELHKQYNTVQSSVAKVEAYRQSVASAELLITATKKSMIGGVRTNLDVLEARKQFFQTKRDLTLASYNYFVAVINFKKAIGTLNAMDLNKISENFVSKQN